MKEFSLPRLAQSGRKRGLKGYRWWIANWANYDPVLPATAELVGPMAGALMHLADGEFGTDAQWGESRVRARELVAVPLPTPQPGHLLPQQLLESMRRHLPAEALLAVDGQSQDFREPGWPTLFPNSFALSNGLVLHGIRAAGSHRHWPPGRRTGCLPYRRWRDADVLGRTVGPGAVDLPVIAVVAVDNAIDLIRSHQIRQGKKPLVPSFPRTSARSRRGIRH